MADCHPIFLEFNKNLNVPAATLAKLKSAQKSIQDYIEKNFKPINGYEFCRFKIQGSKNFGTLIRRRGEKCDIDIGVYVYPKPNAEATSLLRRLYAYIEQYPKNIFKPTLKNKCIRVVYAGNYHIDLPLYYIERKSGVINAHFASRREGWVKNDPRDFENWFKEKKQKNTQLVRIVRYLKAWCHNKSNGERMPKGVALTALAGLLYKPMERDDKALLSILTKIYSKLTKKWSCIMPVLPNDELLRKFSKKDQDSFLMKLASFIADGREAIRLSINDACLLWKRHLGPFFPSI